MKIQQNNNKWLNFWHKLTSGSINRQILGATLVVGFATGLVKFGSVGKELVVAWRFGTGDELDAFLIALVVPSFLINIIAGSFKAALIPFYIKVREQQGTKAAQKLLSTSITWALVLLALMVVLMVSTASCYLPLLASGFTTEKLDLTTKLLWVISPLILLSGIIMIWGAVLNAGEHFALAALSPATIPIMTVILLLFVPNLGIYTLALGLVLGSLLEIFILAIGLRRQKIRILPRLGKFDANLREIAKQYLPVTAGAFLMCSTNLVDQSMAAMLSAGSVSALGYANRIIALPLSLTTLALSTAVIPYFSKTIAEKDWQNIRHTFRYYLRLIFTITIPATVILIVASKLIIQILFERGSFTAEDTEIVSQIQICYALQIPFYIAAIFVVRLINSLGINYLLAWGSSINLIVNISANYLFVQWIGLKGIALSTSFVYLISFVFLYIFTTKKLNKLYKMRAV